MQLVWIGNEKVINLQAIEYIEFQSEECRIIFRGGEKLTLAGDEFRIFRTFMDTKVTTKAPPAGKVGFQRDFIG